ncbi:hypothetical protein A946_01090 [Methylacidiphilum kamchatkense Kam1]|uniref:Uncharacterized protein n=1 Tax=Methylacidiphilum kamchatkense Kam1 TaxID=1202785 RepID=A0A0C1RWM6_9BACT|nr:hypothetical protein A946_01090 [Methylacidiphilum kamchatkense Kam1]QDQ42693.1 hypothetical protein kam1_1472 [Methylacidiphilum kamchatkense Kam1]
MKYRIASDYPLESDWLSAKEFKQHDKSDSAAIAIAIQGVDLSDTNASARRVWAGRKLCARLCMFLAV